MIPKAAETSVAPTAEQVRRPKILVVLGAYLPGYKAGGPLRSIENLVAALGNEFDFRILTSNHDEGDLAPYPGVVTNRWVPVGRAQVMYLPPGLRGVLSICARLIEIDERDTVLYLNSFFSRRHSILPIFLRWLTLCRPRCLVIAPRGEFSPGALRLKQGRKRLYIIFSRWLKLYGGLIWHASSDFEAADIRRGFPRAKHIDIANILAASNEPATGRSTELATASDIGPAPPAYRVAGQKSPGRLRVAFLARLARKKNLSGAIEMLGGVSGDITFDIYGPVEDAGYWKECQRLMAELPANIHAQYLGQIAHEEVPRALAEHDLFFFPTLGENYGHTIAEALAVGCPVLISDQTPWRNLEAEGVGWDLPLEDIGEFRRVLQQCVDGDGKWHAALSERARNYAAQRASDPAVVEANRRLFQRAASWPWRSTDLS